MMEMFFVGLAAGLVVGIAAAYFLITAKFGGKNGYVMGLKVAKKIAEDGTFANKVEQLFVPPPPPKPSGEPVRLLGILQREARLVDFLMEDLQPYSDDQIGASVRDIHAKSQATLKKHVTLEPVFSQPEDSPVSIQAGFDPSSIRLVGNVTGQPPFKGVLKHAGWRAKAMHLPKPPEGQDEFVLMPAEVELS